MELCGSYRFRCRNCQYKFRGNPLRLTDLLYAKCPKCLNQVLEDARPEHVETGVWMSIRSALGANRHYCPHCGTVLASFRPARNRKFEPQPLVTRRVAYKGEGPEVEPMRLPAPVVQVWNWLLEERPIVVRLRLRYRPRQGAAAAGQLMDRP
jgi:DNA-directed RNA polymerase subunit RPC12/RpoP